MPPTLYTKGSLVPLNAKVTKAELDGYIPIHYVLNVCQYKLSKPNPNIHDRILLFKSETGSGKTTVAIVELNRLLNVKDLSMFGDQEDEKLELRTTLPADFSIFDYPEDKFTKQNNKAGQTIINKTRSYIGCTQPKTITAVEKAKENAEAPFNPDIVLGENIGYATGNFKQRFTQPNGMLYMTLGNFYQQLKSNDAFIKIMEKYTIIAIDECHERSIELDLSMFYIRRMLEEFAGNTALPLFIFMSATFDVGKFATYLGTYPDNAIFVSGESAKKTITYLEQPSENYVTDIAKLVMKIHQDNPDDPENERDILIFVHGSPDDNLILEEITKLDKKKEFILLKVNGTNYNSDPMLIDILGRMTIKEAAKEVGISSAKRRVTVSTNVAETGLTIPTLKYVIDSGWEKATFYSPNKNLGVLAVKEVTQSSSTQRLGRVGRKFYGYAFCMYTEPDFGKFKEYKLPDIYTNNISKNILEMMYSDFPRAEYIDKLNQEDFIKFSKKCLKTEPDMNSCGLFCNNIGELSDKNDYPPELLDNIMQDTYLISRNKIFINGFYKNYLGYIASRIPRLSIESIRMILLSFAYGASMNDMVYIAILAESKSKDYLYSQLDEKRSNNKNIKQFSVSNIIGDIVSKDIIKKHYFGSVKNFNEIFYDDFIRSLMIIRFITINTHKLTKSNPGKIVGSLRALCQKNGINYNGLMITLDMMKNVISVLNEFGFTNNTRELNFSSENLIDDICRIKKCIYGGYKSNIAFRKNGYYETTDGVKFNVFIKTDRKPKRIIFNYLIAMNKPRTINYNVLVDSVAYLDGFL